jgi:hypothetical protein
LLDLCRRTHESFATFAGGALAATVDDQVDAVVARYPAYMPLLRSVERALGKVPAPNRRYLLATQYARVCMQTPILDLLMTGGLAGPSDLRVRDTPDGR